MIQRSIPPQNSFRAVEVLSQACFTIEKGMMCGQCAAYSKGLIAVFQHELLRAPKPPVGVPCRVKACNVRVRSHPKRKQPRFLAICTWHANSIRRQLFFCKFILFQPFFHWDLLRMHHARQSCTR